MIVSAGERLLTSEVVNELRPIILGDGLIGRALAKKFPFARVVSRHNSGLDISDRRSLNHLLDQVDGPVVINAAGYTDVDGAQKNMINAYRVNVTGAENVARVCAEMGRHLIHISSGFVFDGSEESAGPYDEQQVPDADSRLLGVYARSKAIAEDVVRAVLNDHVSIIRIDYPTTEEGGWLLNVLTFLKRGYSMYDNQKITPTSVEDLWHAIDAIADQQACGVFHVASPTRTTPYEYAAYVLQQLGDTRELKHGTLETPTYESGRAPRPLNGGLNVARTQDQLGLTFTTWQRQVDLYLHHFKNVL